MKGVGRGGQLRVLAVYGQGVLGQVVGPDGEEVHLGRVLLGEEGGGRNLDHDAQRDAGRIERGANLLADGAETAYLLQGSDHGEHHGQSVPLPGGAVEGADLRVEELRPAEQQTHAAHAEERVLLVGKVQVRDALVPADVEGPDDEGSAAEGTQHGAVDLVLLVLGRGRVPLQEEELRAHQSDALAAHVDGLRDLGRPVDVCGDRDDAAVGGPSRLHAGGPFRLLPLLEGAHSLLGGRQVLLGGVQPDPAGVPVDDGRRGGFFQEIASQGDDSGEPEGTRDDRGVRRRPAQGRDEPCDPLPVQPGGVRW